MSRIGERLRELKATGRKGLIVYITAGYPDYQTTLSTIKAVIEEGADMVEIGLPFSDPMADGPILQKAATEALAAGATIGKALELAAILKEQTSIPMAVMTYYNPVLRFGVEKFVRDFAAAGISGLIIPDLPIEEAGEVESFCRQANIDLIKFIAPTTTPKRIKAICHGASGFLYCISSTGVTGVRKVEYKEMAPLLNAVRKETELPLAIGFGIGSGEAARLAARQADAVIVGSAIMERLMNQGVDAVRELTCSIRQALDEECE